ncbi:MAG TPA: hypothetical protein VKP88_01175 [Candidatus Paceibacterota bacterium]|nr:hypothetical protein [Candidatus Paceibacterota bacterium]
MKEFKLSVPTLADAKALASKAKAKAAAKAEARRRAKESKTLERELTEIMREIETNRRRTILREALQEATRRTGE